MKRALLAVRMCRGYRLRLRLIVGELEHSTVWAYNGPVAASGHPVVGERQLFSPATDPVPI